MINILNIAGSIASIIGLFFGIIGLVCFLLAIAEIRRLRNTNLFTAVSYMFGDSELEFYVLCDIELKIFETPIVFASEKPQPKIEDYFLELNQLIFKLWAGYDLQKSIYKFDKVRFNLLQIDKQSCDKFEKLLSFYLKRNEVSISEYKTSDEYKDHRDKYIKSLDKLHALCEKIVVINDNCYSRFWQRTFTNKQLRECFLETPQIDTKA